MNLILTPAVILFIIVVLFIWLRRGGKRFDRNDPAVFELDVIINYLKDAFQQLVSDNDDLNVSEAEYNKRKDRVDRLRRALRICMQGDIKMKKYVKTWINKLLLQYGVNEKTIDYIIPFNKPEQLSIERKFDILLYHFSKKYQYRAFAYMIDHYELNKPKMRPDGRMGYIIFEKEIQDIYSKVRPKLSFKDKMNVVTQYVYQNYKGHGPIDEIRDMYIDGVSGGVSGLPVIIAEKLDVANFVQQMQVKIPRCYDSVWIMYKMISINLAFLSFGSEKELKRVCQNIYTNGYPGQLNESVGYVINEMADGSRVVVIRPKLGENWAFFVRKFDDSIVTIDKLIKGENADKVIRLIDFLVKGHRGIAITGAMGSGKTTLLKVICGFISPKLPIRVLEQAFELFLKKYFPFDNIFTLKQTSTVSQQEALDMSKKTDGGVMVLGEVASHPVAKLAIQISQSGSSQVLLTGHHNTAEDLIHWFSDGIEGDNPVLKAANALNIDIHLTQDDDFGRHIERITEIIPLVRLADYPTDYRDPNKSFHEAIIAFMDTMTEFFKRSTDRKVFDCRNIVEFRDGSFVAVYRPSKGMVKEMVKAMGSEKGKEFLHLLDEIEWEAEEDVHDFQKGHRILTVSG